MCLTLGTACNTARDQQQKANEAQAEADRKIADATQKANAQINEAQADADKKKADAQANFDKLREDYRHDVNVKLADLDKKIADLEAKAKTEPPKKRAELDAKLTDIHASREAFANEYRGLETASAATWDDTKKRLDKSWNDLEAKVNHA
jgi:hypothetical protein